MTKRQARKIANGIAYKFVQAAIDAGPANTGTSEKNALRIENELDRIAQMLFDRSNLVAETRLVEP